MESDKRELLARIIIRIKAGMEITQALKAENCSNAYYRNLTAQERAPVNAARREYEEGKATESQRTRVRITVETTLQRHQDFQAHCEALGINMTRRMNYLMVMDMNAHKNPV